MTTNPTMCHAHLTVHKPCHHTHSRLTLCHASLLPLITKRLARHPSLSPLDIQKYLIAADSEHHVTITTAQSVEPCCDCQLPDLDIWDLDGAVKIIGDVAKLERRKGWRVDFEVGDGRDGVVAGESVDGEVSDSIAAEEGLVTPQKGKGHEMLNAVAAKAVQEKSDCDACVMALPYVGGLGLLVMAQKQRRSTPRAKL